MLKGRRALRVHVAAALALVTTLLAGCGRPDPAPSPETTAQVERVRLELVAQLDAARTDAAAKADRIATLSAEIERLRAVEGASRASRGVRRSSTVSGSCGRWTVLLAAYPWPVGQACSVLLCESRGDPSARNPSGANGLMQVMHGPMDPAANIAVAYRLYAARGWAPWVCKP